MAGHPPGPRSARIQGANCSNVPGPEVAHIVKLVAMERRRDAVTVRRRCRDVRDQLAVPERLVVDRQRILVVADLLEDSHNAGAQSVVAAVRIQDACSLLTAQDFHRREVDPRPMPVLGI